MNAQVKSVVEDCTKGSEEGRLNFSQQLKKLAEAGVEGYYADLRRSTKVYYLPDGGSIEVSASEVGIHLPEELDAAGVEAAVRQAQAGAIGYRTFCEKVMAAGCSGYIVSIPGRRVVYFGRSAETHVEYFPAAA
jgi:uncharacterized protein YbcV (DUF1398 family)